MRTGQSRKRDANEAPIIKALEAIGVEVTQISGAGAPDLLCRRGGHLWAFEVKGDKGRLTKAQEATRWPVIRSVPEALALFGVR